ncbi:TolB family protein [Archangium lansingense]|uniref:Dipeptidylpeptidase IV N-terminal domain-containing protein n=1 Tax=Archangium lansingense TaxID=2995310 RepID=A0ABT4AIP4_9BACT|nr:hypothetical protein [Archangium lansinium]MCY1081548.1 hypothetical protein [Archangium lansinium]
MDGQHQWPLTSSGKVSFYAGAAISPDGKQVAWVEFQAPGSRRGPEGGWNKLFIVNADGTARRELLDLTRQPLPEGQLMARHFRWSDDGKSIAFVLEHLASKEDPWACGRVFLYSVDVASGHLSPLPEVGLLGHVTLLDWWPAREELTLYVECALRPEEGVSYYLPPMSTLVAVLRVSDGALRTEVASEPSLSPDGTFVFLPSRPRFRSTPTVYRTAALGGPLALTLAAPLVLPYRYVGRLTWLHRSLAALVSATRWEGPGMECVGTQPQPRTLFRLNPATGALQQVRADATALNVVAISPDDTHALVGIITGMSEEPSIICGKSPAERLFLVPLEDLASELPLEELQRRGTPLTPPRAWSSTRAFFEYVGWVR